jgi:hypothetical protein
MYSACLFCNRPLGANEVIETFPVGRRLAFDPEKGRLWVVCPSCERWNLTPLEERWEAIEQAERLFRETRLRVSTDQIGLTRLREGLELVRIGKPSRPEIAAWRYGDQFGRRRRVRLIGAGVMAAGGVLVIAGGAVAGLSIFGTWNVGRLLFSLGQHGNPIRTVGRFRLDNGRMLKVQRKHLAKSRLRAGEDGQLALELEHDVGRIVLAGADARRAASVIFPAVNHFGGTREDVQRAVRRLEHAGGSEEYLTRMARSGEKLTPIAEPERDWVGRPVREEHESGLLALPISVRLAVEMALHEEQERRALEGELHELERAWREAEEVAGIADSLLLPTWIDDRLKRMR